MGKIGGNSSAFSYVCILIYLGCIDFFNGLKELSFGFVLRVSLPHSHSLRSYPICRLAYSELLHVYMYLKNFCLRLSS